MHLDSFTRKPPFFTPDVSPFFQANMVTPVTRFEHLQWVQSSTTRIVSTVHNSTKLFTYDFSKPLTRVRNSLQSFNHFIANRLSSKYRVAMLMLGLSVLIFPAKYYLQSTTSAPTGNALDSTLSAPVLTLKPNNLIVATVKANGTYFADDKAGFSYEHGFGYDVVRNYADELGAKVAIEVFNTPEEALQAVSKGQADMALTSLKTDHKAYFQPIVKPAATSMIPIAFTQGSPATEQPLKALSISCHKDFLQKNGLDTNLSLSISASNMALAQNASNFLCSDINLALNEKLAGFYTQNILKDDYSQQHFSEAMREKLPMFQYSFKQSAKTYEHDWQLLVAMSYQESHLEVDATSPTGVQGIMMLTNDTAKAMGVNDRIDPVQSIQGGAKYLNQLSGQFKDINESDRVWFMLASYNMGPMAIKNIQTNLSRQGKNPNSWAEVYRYMAENSNKNRRYIQCMEYVTNIRGYLEQIKQGNGTSFQAQTTNNNLKAA